MLCFLGNGVTVMCFEMVNKFIPSVAKLLGRFSSALLTELRQISLHPFFLDKFMASQPTPPNVPPQK